jgi:hypothetical protein
VAKIRYTYSTPDNPDHTILATVENAPQVVWNPKSDYGKTLTLATSNTSAADILAFTAATVTVKQSGKYKIAASVTYFVNAVVTTWSSATIKVGAAGTTQVSFGASAFLGTGDPNGYPLMPVEVYLNAGDIINLRPAVAATGVANRTIYGDNLQVGATGFSFKRID